MLVPRVLNSIRNTIEDLCFSEVVERRMTKRADSRSSSTLLKCKGRRKPGTNSGHEALMWILYFAISISIILEACEPKPLEIFPFHIKVTTDKGKPIEGASIGLDAELVGKTNRSGSFHLKHRGYKGERISLTMQCPYGFQSESKKRSIVLRHFNRISDEDVKEGITIAWQCIPKQRTAALVVRCQGHSYLPVTRQGEVLGKTDRDGIAHFLLQEEPDATLYISIDTSNHPKLMPQNPVNEFQIKDEDALFVFDQKFIRKRIHRRTPKTDIPEQKHVPYRVD